METEIYRELQSLDDCIRRRRLELERLAHPLPLNNTHAYTATSQSPEKQPVEQMVQERVGKIWVDPSPPRRFRDTAWVDDRQARSDGIERLSKEERERAEAWDLLLEDRRRRILELEMELVNTTTTKAHLLERVRRLDKDRTDADGVITHLKDERKQFVDTLLESKRYLDEHDHMLNQFSAMHQSDL